MGHNPSGRVPHRAGLPAKRSAVGVTGSWRQPIDDPDRTSAAAGASSLRFLLFVFERQATPREGTAAAAH
jgi:hypothetical protein